MLLVVCYLTRHTKQLPFTNNERAHHIIERKPICMNVSM